MRRTLAAALLTLLTVASLSLGWGTTALRGARAERTARREAPGREAEDQLGRLEEEIRDRLERLRQLENRRPYYEYQNLYHDPRGASEGDSVAPSSLASGPVDPLIQVNFQVLPNGKVTIPTLNPELPQFSQVDREGQDRQWQQALQHVSGQLVAQAPLPEPRLRPLKSKPAVMAALPLKQMSPASQVQAQAFNVTTYAQNQSPNRVYLKIQREQAARNREPAPKDRGGQAAGVTVWTRDFEWNRSTVNGQPQLVALRSVQTPDGVLAQGFVIALQKLVSDRPSPYPASLGWQPTSRHHRLILTHPALFASVGSDAAEHEAWVQAGVQYRTFLIQSSLVLTLALVCSGLVVALVARAERLARQRSEFAAAAAHELRTPLAGLHLYGEMLAEGLGQPERQRDYAQRIASEAARLGRVVGNVLGFTQLERRALAVPTRPGDAAQAVQAVVERMAPSLEHVGVKIRAELPDAAPARFDQDAVGRILQNLIDNAAKYGRGAPSAEVEIHLHADKGEVRISIADRGPGVSRSLRRRLFRPFGRGAPDGGVAGLGLGLALSRAQARAMGGDLTYADAQGGGAVFTLHLVAA